MIERFKKSEMLYFHLTWVMVIMSIILLAFGYIALKFTFPAPAIIVEGALILLYSHAIHFIYGIYRLFYFRIKIKRQKTDIKIFRSIISMLLSPISAIVLYTAIIMLAFSGCST